MAAEIVDYRKGLLLTHVVLIANIAAIFELVGDF